MEDNCTIRREWLSFLPFCQHLPRQALALDAKKKKKVSHASIAKKRRKERAQERADIVREKLQTKAQRHVAAKAVKVRVVKYSEPGKNERLFFFSTM